MAVPFPAFRVLESGTQLQPGAGLQTYPVLMYFSLIARAEKTEVKWKVIRIIIWGSFVSRGHKSFLYSSLKEYNLVIILSQ